MRDILGNIDGTALPDSTNIEIVVSPADTYLTPEAAEKVFSAQEKGLLIYDLIQSATQPEQLNTNRIFGPEFSEASPEIIKVANEESTNTFGGSQHSASNLQAHTLLRLVALKVQNKHRVCLREQESVD